MKQTVWAVVIVVVGLSVGDKVAAGPRADKPVVFVAHDYGFTGPDRIPAGMTTVQIVNQGKDLHHVQIMQLTEGEDGS
jgi:hypothetical protein